MHLQYALHCADLDVQVFIDDTTDYLICKHLFSLNFQIICQFGVSAPYCFYISLFISFSRTKHGMLQGIHCTCNIPFPYISNCLNSYFTDYILLYFLLNPMQHPYLIIHRSHRTFAVFTVFASQSGDWRATVRTCNPYGGSIFLHLRHVLYIDHLQVIAGLILPHGLFAATIMVIFHRRLNPDDTEPFPLDIPGYLRFVNLYLTVPFCPSASADLFDLQFGLSSQTR